MKYTIGFITTDYFYKEHILSLTEKTASLCTLKYIILDYIDESKTLEAYENYVDSVDAFMCSGTIPYSILKNKVAHWSIPITYLSLSEHDFYLYLFKELNAHRTLDFSKIFIDFLREDNQYYHMNFAFDKQKPYTIADFGIAQPITDFHQLNEDLLKIHCKLHEDKKIDLSITRSYFTHKRLCEAGLSSIYMFPSDASMVLTLEETIQAIELDRLDKNKIALCIISIHSSEYKDESLIFRSAEIQDQLYHMIQESVDQSLSPDLIIKKNNLNIEIQTTKENLITMTDHYASFSLVNKLLSKIKYRINIGWGVGRTIVHAEKNAMIANRKSAELNESCTFIVTDLNKVIGPLTSNSGGVQTEQYAIAEQLSYKVALSTSNIYKILSLIDQLHTNLFSSEDLARSLNITLRSANRILKILQDANVAVLSSTKQESQRGRPKNIFQIDFSSYQ